MKAELKVKSHQIKIEKSAVGLLLCCVGVAAGPRADNCLETFRAGFYA